jgi:ParB family chromosome partitioning protein
MINLTNLTNAVKSSPSAKGAKVPFDQIDISIHHRPTHADKVGDLVKSIRMLGLQAAPVVIERDGRYKLVSGRHRLEAIRVLGYEEAPVRIVGFDDLQARMWTISENLHRNELSALDQAEQIAEYARLTSEKLEGKTQEAVKTEGEAEPQAAASDPKKARQVGAVGGRGNEGGNRATARELGVPEQTVRRAAQVDSITPAAKEAVRDAGLDHNQSALLKVASYADEDQVEAVKEIAREKAEKAAAPRTAATIAPRPLPLRNLENIAAGALARWVKETTPNDRLHVIDVLERAAAILRDELQATQAPGRRVQT